MPKLDEAFPLPPFEGLKPKAMAFFRNLNDNQNKKWFAANKADYETLVRGPLQSLVAEVSARLEKAKILLRGDPHRALFRINRDVRFSKDKRPYNTHASAALTRDGEKNSPSVLYIHIDPAGSFVAAGFFRPEPTILHSLRAGLVADPVGWGKVSSALSKAALALSTDEAPVRVPKGFENAPPKVADALKLKSWVVRSELTAADISRPRLVDDVVTLAKDAAPLLNFGWNAMARAT